MLSKLKGVLLTYIRVYAADKTLQCGGGRGGSVIFCVCFPCCPNLCTTDTADSAMIEVEVDETVFLLRLCLIIRLDQMVLLFCRRKRF